MNTSSPTAITTSTATTSPQQQLSHNNDVNIIPLSKHIPTYLRSALRVIHCLQKERGGSSLYTFRRQTNHNKNHSNHNSSSSNNNNNNRAANDEVTSPSPPPNPTPPCPSTTSPHPDIGNTRQRTDAAISFFKESCSVANVSLDVGTSWEASLLEIRNQVQHFGDDDDDEDEVEEVEVKVEENDDDDDKKSSSSSSQVMISSHRILSSYHRLIEHVISMSVVQVVTQAETNFAQLKAAQQQQQQSILLQTIAETKTTGTTSSSSPETKDDNHQQLQQQSKSLSLLALIMSFVKLKESTGLERAILSSLMVLGNFNSDLRLKLFSDLVVEEANQRSIIRELQEQTKYALLSDRENSAFYENFKGLMALVEHFVKPSLEMERLQNMISQEFNIEGLQRLMPVQEFWEMITLYIDQLHALELLFIEELQTSWMSSCSGEEEEETPITPLSSPSEGTITSTASKSPLSTIPLENLDVFPSITPPHSSKEWEIDLYEIEFRKRIGAGVGGTTYLARWSGGDVAVKVAAITGIGLEGWHTEVVNLQRLHHPNVIRLLGIFNNASPQTYGLVLEYCNAGDLSGELM